LYKKNTFGKYRDHFLWDRECATREDYKKTTTRILPSGGTPDGWFTLNFQFISLGSGVTDFTMDQQLQVKVKGTQA
jgi:hypothetical protein